MKIILANSKHGVKEVFVDDEDFEWLNQWKWYAVKKPHTFYAVRGDYSLGKYNRKGIIMHRLVLGLTDPEIRGDHKDHNGLNNVRDNLRSATGHQNSMNCSKKKKNALSKYIGVSVITMKHKTGIKKLWVASLRYKYKYVYLGNFPYNDVGEMQAAAAYDEGAKKYFGDFANLNLK